MTRQFKNDLSDPTSRISGNITAIATGVSVQPGEGARFPATGDFSVRMESELCLCTSRTVDTLTLVRGDQGTTAAIHNDLTAIDLVLTADDLTTFLSSKLNTASPTFTGTLSGPDLILAGESIVGAGIYPGLANGSFGLNKRGTGPVTASGSYGPDMWKLNIGAGSALQWDPEFTIVYNVASLKSAKFTYTHVASSKIENKYSDYSQIRLRTITYSCWVKTSTANAVRLGFSDGVVQSFGAYHTGSGAWELLSVTFTVNATSTTALFEIWFEATGTHYADQAWMSFGSSAGVYRQVDPYIEGYRLQTYYYEMKVSLEAYADAANRITSCPLPMKLSQSIGVTGTLIQKTAGTSVNLAAGWPQVDDVSVVTGVVASADGARLTIKSAALGQYSVKDLILSFSVAT